MINIRIVTTGQFSSELNIPKITTWKSVLFKVVDYQHHNLQLIPDLPNWGYSDRNLNTNLPTPEGLKNTSTVNETAHVNVFLLDAPLEYNYYSRILDNDCVVVTYYQIREILYKEDIPLENFMLRLLYAYSFIYLAKQGRHMSMLDEARFAHGSIGCLFDMCGIKTEVIYSSVSPSLCGDCENKLKGKVQASVINKVKKELRNIRKDFYHQMLSFLKNHPYLSLAISGFAAILLNILSNAIFEWINNII